MFGRSFLEARTLNRLAIRCLVRNEKIAPDVNIVASNVEVRSVLTSPGSAFTHESGFFRIGGESLSEPAVRLGSSLVRELFGSISSDEAYRRVTRVLATAVAARGVRTRGDGQRMMLAFYANEIADSRSHKLENAVVDYVNCSVIPGDIRRIQGGPDRARLAFRERVGECVQYEERRSEPKDLLDVAFKVAQCDANVPEIYQRLILSTVGFSGCALEWLLLHMAEHGGSVSENFAKESIRIGATACRLARVVSGGEIQIGELSIGDGEQIILNNRHSLRDPTAWRDPEKFDPDRWRDPKAGRLDTSFGKGRRSCPGQNSARIALDAFYAAANQYEIHVRRKIGSRDLVGTLNAPPSAHVRLVQR